MLLRFSYLARACTVLVEPFLFSSFVIYLNRYGTRYPILSTGQKVFLALL